LFLRVEEPRAADEAARKNDERDESERKPDDGDRPACRRRRQIVGDIVQAHAMAGMACRVNARRAISAATTSTAAKPTGAFTNGKMKTSNAASPMPDSSYGKNPRARPRRNRNASGTANTTRS